MVRIEIFAICLRSRVVLIMALITECTHNSVMTTDGDIELLSSLCRRDFPMCGVEFEVDFGG